MTYVEYYNDNRELCKLSKNLRQDISCFYDMGSGLVWLEYKGKELTTKSEITEFIRDTKLVNKFNSFMKKCVEYLGVYKTIKDDDYYRIIDTKKEITL